ncbi:related to c-module-binding factor [Phialocephala subalpina]|uniref:Related to c-module-binding factor n=1 Tax=Phialocephala subalpina TaxID=576137 RepID=A0A1L7WK58_9HELO|nr:related to c-module-binding factor [Phialocephala subalpina]
MPSQTHPQAQFVPISPDFDLDALVQEIHNFDFVTRLSTDKLREHSIQSFEALVEAIVIENGKPLVVEDWGSSLPPWLFSRDWLEQNLGKEPQNVRDIPNEANIPMTMGHYLRSMDQLTRQFESSTYRNPKRQRLYLKDIDCPDMWADHLKQVLPECIYYLNDCIESRTGGDGSILEPNEYGQMQWGKGVAPAGDLMSSLPEPMRAQNMMCYIGHEGTYTAAHREMCGTLGHNIMVEASDGSKGEKPGSSVWFMTETKEREVVSEYFLSMLGHDIEVEKHFAQVNAWKKAPFNVYVVEQKPGDLILIPSLAPHQVWNRGTRTMKVAWNRTTIDTLELALHEALPRARMVCREEQYKCKAIVYYTLAKYHALLQRDTIEPKMWKYGRIKSLLEQFKRLFDLYQEILVSEMFSPKLPEQTNVELIPYDSFITCSYCRGNIFNRFLTCKSCIQRGEDANGEPVEDTYDVCMDCYAMGRSCACVSGLSWVEQWDWSTLMQNYEQWRNVVVQSDGFFDAKKSPQPLDIARKRYGRKPIAEVCQEQLKLRPFKDPNRDRSPTPEMSDVEPEVDDEGRLKPRKGEKTKKGAKVYPKSHAHTCHICFKHHGDWKMAFCTTCNLSYCYGVLWRAFDLMPQAVMEDKEWQCPRCLKMCSCAKCRKNTTNIQKPYEPKGTLLGHDTKKVADFRSVESLVDFSKTNLLWLRDEHAHNPHESARMKRLKEKVEAEKARANDESFHDANGIEDDPFDESMTNGFAQSMQDIDPTLRGPGLAIFRENDNGYQYRDSYEAAQHGANPYAVENPDESAPGWADGHYDLDDYNSYNQPPASYPSRLLTPIAPMMREPEETYQDPAHAGQNRMMGIGYYQQDGTIDRILYDPPVTDGMIEEPPQQPTPSKNPNMMFSDLLDPQMTQAEQPKKRKRINADGEDEDDVEFFTSKKHKLAAATKKHKQEYQLEGVAHPSRPEKRVPRRSTGKPQSYQDLGEAAVPIEEDEGPSSLAGPRKRKPENTDSDLELAAQAFSRLTKPKPKEKSTAPAPARKRRSIRAQESTRSSGSPSLAPNTIKTPRKSAWLARKEAQDAGKSFPDELPKRTRRKRGEAAADREGTASHIVDLDSASEDGDNDDGGVSLNSDKDSLFGEPVEREEGGEGDSTWKTTEIDENVQIAERSSKKRKEVQQKPEPAKEARGILNGAGVGAPAPKRRGRPPKNRPSMPLVDTRSESPPMIAPEAEAEAAPTPAPKLLSLKEKLALKGKSFKIVAAKSQAVTVSSPGRLSAIASKQPVSRAPSTGPSSSRSTPSIPPKSILKTPAIPSPIGWNSVNNPYLMKLGAVESSAASPSTASTSNKSTPITKAPIPTPKKGPTVVRLMSPGSAPERPESIESSASDSSSDDEDIPAFRPALIMQFAAAGSHKDDLPV